MHKDLLKYLLIIVLIILPVKARTQEASNVNNYDSNKIAPVKELKLKDNNKKKQGVEKYRIDPLKTGLITGFTVGAGIWLHNYQKNAWWSGQRGEFHFQNDWYYAMSADKLGHFFDGALIQSLYHGAFEWAGFKPSTALWMGTAFSIAYMTDVEIEDGFASEWGFSPGDETFNILGALYPVAQFYAPVLKEFSIKWSYYPSEDLTTGNKHGAFLDDYNGQTFWFSVGFHHFLPERSKKYWPDFINIAVGYGVEHYTDYSSRYENYYIVFDYDLRKIIPGDSRFMNWFKTILNYFRFIPAPGIRINKYGVEYVVNF